MTPRITLLGAAAALILVLAGIGARLSPAAGAEASAPCSDSLTGAPTGPASVSAASTEFGRVLVVGSGPYAGCSLYLLTSDQLHALNGSNFACSDDVNKLGAPCDSVLWPALLTNGAPIAGTGVNPTLLGTVTRTDIPGMGAVQQVTYAGQPLYRFLFDEEVGEFEGQALFDPVTSTTGTWYLVDPSRGQPAASQARIGTVTAPVGGSGPSETVLAATMNDDFSLFANANFPVYTLSGDNQKSACQGLCAIYWEPLLTTGRPQATAGVDQHALGIIVRPDGTHQVTYNGNPLYLFAGDAYIGGLPYGDARIDGDGLSTPWGTFHAVPQP